ncbi:MAG TPA: hypothetical protein VFZ26_15360 [Gemmatimonadales bacterium]
MDAGAGKPSEATNGAALAAILAGGIGAFAMGLVVILNEAGLFAAPSLYAPAGGVSGRTTIAVAIWLMAWAVLHTRWKGRQVEDRPVHAATLALIALGIVLCLPPVWKLF